MCRGVLKVCDTSFFLLLSGCLGASFSEGLQVCFGGQQYLDSSATSTLHDSSVFPFVGKKKYACEKCGKMFTKKHGLLYHINAVHENVKFQCRCGKVYNHRRSLLYHLTTSPSCNAEKTT